MQWFCLSCSLAVRGACILACACATCSVLSSCRVSSAAVPLISWFRFTDRHRTRIFKLSSLFIVSPYVLAWSAIALKNLLSIFVAAYTLTSKRDGGAQRTSPRHIAAPLSREVQICRCETFVVPEFLSTCGRSPSFVTLGLCLSLDLKLRHSFLSARHFAHSFLSGFSPVAFLSLLF
jgi:hypothetical protein